MERTRPESKPKCFKSNEYKLFFDFLTIDSLFGMSYFPNIIW